MAHLAFSAAGVAVALTAFFTPGEAGRVRRAGEVGLEAPVGAGRGLGTPGFAGALAEVMDATAGELLEAASGAGLLR